MLIQCENLNAYLDIHSVKTNPSKHSTTNYFKLLVRVRVFMLIEKIRMHYKIFTVQLKLTI